MNLKEKGILYIAYGEKAILNVEHAISILRNHNRTLPVAVISDQKINCDVWIEQEDLDLGARSIKTRMYQFSPFQKTLYLDADTELQCDPEPYFDILDSVDLIMALDWHMEFRENTWQGLLPEETRVTLKETNGGYFLYYNTGVIFFNKCDSVEKLMTAWHEEWKRWGRQDQPAMFRAMVKNPVRLAPMEKKFNTHKKSEAMFVYHAHRRASREGAPK
jgi:hypothetical protein